MREKVRSRLVIQAAEHGSSHRLYGLVHHGSEGLQAGRAPPARQPCTMGMHTAGARQAVRTAAAQTGAGSTLDSAPCMPARPDAFRTGGAAPLKHYLVCSATGAGVPSAPAVRPHCTVRLWQAAGELGAAGRRRAVGLVVVVLLFSTKAPFVAPLLVLAVCVGHSPHAMETDGRFDRPAGWCHTPLCAYPPLFEESKKTHRGYFDLRAAKRLRRLGLA